MIFKNKNIVIYGGGSFIAAAIAKAFAREGAHIFLTSKRQSSLKQTAQNIENDGGNVTIAEVDALDYQSILQHAQDILKKRDSIDIAFNAVGFEDVQNIALIDMDLNDFIRPITRAMSTHFLTAKVVGAIMRQQQSGVILSLSATPGGIGYPYVGGFGPACNAMEGFSKNLAAELGEYGVRVINIRSAGSPDSRPFLQALEQEPDLSQSFLRKLEKDTMLNRLPSIDDIANIALFLASDQARAITGVTVDATCGTTSALKAD